MKTDVNELALKCAFQHAEKFKKHLESMLKLKGMDSKKWEIEKSISMVNLVKNTLKQMHDATEKNT